jgi:hypothetical protein
MAKRTPTEVRKAIDVVNELQASGMSREAALKHVNLSSAVYYKHKKDRAGGKVSGSINVDALPPRPKKSKRGGYQKARAVNLDDVASVAGRISKLDKKIAEVDALASERRKLADVLLKLLKA